MKHAQLKYQVIPQTTGWRGDFGLPSFKQRRNGRSRSNVWHYAGVSSRSYSKPIRLVAAAIKDCARRGDVVLDTFAGLGTTVMAAERVGRQARALELEPRFVDVAVRRWQAFTHKSALHAESGLSFDEIAADSARSGQAFATK